MIKILVIYHANCVDGWVAALQAYLFYRELRGSEVTYLSMQYGDPLPDNLAEYDTVYLLDFSAFPLTDNMIVLDHHKSALDRINDADRRGTLILDMSKSGARLAFEYFFPSRESDWLVDYAEDHDLWKFELPFSREMKAGLHLLPRLSIEGDGPVWLSVRRGSVLTSGRIVNKYITGQVAGLASKAVPLRIGNYQGMVINNGQWVSEVGEAVLSANKSLDFVANWFITGDKKLVVSLRGPYSRVIAEIFGGGGHDLAAGFTIDRSRVWRCVEMIVDGTINY